MNLMSGEWDDLCCSSFGISQFFLPRIVPNSLEFGTLAEGEFKGIPITGMIADQQASLLSISRGKIGQLKCTFGTGCFILTNASVDQHILPESKVFKTVAYQFEDEPLHHALECYVPACGCIFQWILEELSFACNFNELDCIAKDGAHDSRLRFVPPTEHAKGALEGITIGTRKSELVYSIYRGVFENIAMHIGCIGEQLASPAAEIFVDGGLCRSNFCMQLQANLALRTVKRFKFVEATALGAAICALKGCKKSLCIGELFPDEASKYDIFRPEL